MEAFLKDNDVENAKKVLVSIMGKDFACVKTRYAPDPLIASFLLAKNSKGDIAITFSDTANCDIELRDLRGDRYIVYGGNNIIHLYDTSFSSLFPLSLDDLIPILAGIFSSVVLERRPLTDYEKTVLQNAQNLGVLIEKGLKVPSYKALPAFISLILSLDPFIPGITGNREGTIKMIKELDIDETTPIVEMKEEKLNSLIYRIVSSIINYNPKFSRDDLITDRVFYLEFDTLELAFATLYFFDIKGSSSLFQLVSSPSYAENMILTFREKLSKGFSVGDVVEDKEGYIVKSTLDSPLLTQLILLQLQKVKKDKKIFLDINGEIFTSRYFLLGENEGLIKVDIRGKDKS